MALSEQNRLKPPISGPRLRMAQITLWLWRWPAGRNTKDLGWSESIPTIPGSEDLIQQSTPGYAQTKGLYGAVALSQGRGPMWFTGHLSLHSGWEYVGIHVWSEELRYQCRTLIFITSGGWRNLGNFSRAFSSQAYSLKGLLSLAAVTFSLALRTNNSKAS